MRQLLVQFAMSVLSSFFSLSLRVLGLIRQLDAPSGRFLAAADVRRRRSVSLFPSFEQNDCYCGLLLTAASSVFPWWMAFGQALRYLSRAMPAGPCETFDVSQSPGHLHRHAGIVAVASGVSASLLRKQASVFLLSVECSLVAATTAVASLKEGCESGG